jgi:hypothetical protein
LGLRKKLICDKLLLYLYGKKRGQEYRQSDWPRILKKRLKTLLAGRRGQDNGTEGETCAGPRENTYAHVASDKFEKAFFCIFLPYVMNTHPLAAAAAR